MGIAQSVAAGTVAVRAYQTEQKEYQFFAYDVMALPADKHVFLVRNKAINPVIVEGALHYNTNFNQEETQTFATNSVIFQTKQNLTFFNDVSRKTVLLGQARDFQFFFSSLNQFTDYLQDQPNYYYRGDAVYPLMYDMIIEDPLDYKLDQVASNSFPLWLQKYDDPKGLSWYPTFLLPSNLRPPFVVWGTTGQQAMHNFLRRGDRGSQMTSERTVLHLFGLKHNEALDLLDRILEDQRNDDAPFGITNIPNLRDNSSVIQRELGIKAIYKVIELDVSFDLAYAEDVAFKLAPLLLQASVEFTNP